MKMNVMQIRLILKQSFGVDFSFKRLTMATSLKTFLDRVSGSPVLVSISEILACTSDGSYSKDTDMHKCSSARQADG